MRRTGPATPSASRWHLHGRLLRVARLFAKLHPLWKERACRRPHTRRCAIGSKLPSMDTVRFGRVLGHGARQAAKTLVSAVDAATAPNPSHPNATGAKRAPTAATSDQPVPRETAPSRPPVRATASASGLAESAADASPDTRPVATILPPSLIPRPSSTRPPSPKRPPLTSTARGVAEGSRRFGRAVWAPAVRLSGVLWLELTGVFFGLFALVAGIAVWRLHTALYAMSSSAHVPASDDRTRLFFAAGMVVVFGYFSFSSFLKANRRSRRP